MKLNLRVLYLYLFSFVGLIITVIGGIRLIELALKVYVFKDADRYEYARPSVIKEEGDNISKEEAEKLEAEQQAINERESKRQRQREASGAIAMLLVGFPLYKYHWSLIQKENKNSKFKNQN